MLWDRIVSMILDCIVCTGTSGMWWAPTRITLASPLRQLSSIWSWTPALRFQVPVIQYSQIFKQTHLREFNYHDTTTQIHSGWFLVDLVRTSLDTLRKKKMLTMKGKKYHVTEDFYLMIIKSESFITPLNAFIFTCFTLCKGVAVCRGGGEGEQNFFQEAEGGVFH